MTKHVFSPADGWRTIEDRTKDPNSGDAMQSRAPATVFAEEAPEVKFDLENLPFKKVLNNHLIVLIDKYKRPKGRRIIISEKEQRSSTKGNVVAIADNITDIKIGDKVLFTQFGGTLLVFEGIPFMRALGYEEILSILKDDAPDLISGGN